MQEIHFAPLQGYVDNAYRRLHSQIYGGVDCYYTPFIRIEKGEPRRQDIARLKASVGDGTPLVPQIIFASPEEFRILTEAVKALGFNRIDLNLGCPYPMQTNRGRGAAMISDIATMEQIVKQIDSDCSTSYSVKMRLGKDNPDEWRSLLPLLSSVKLNHIAIHPRIARQMYSGDLYIDEFRSLESQSSNPIVWNGEIRNIGDLSAHTNAAAIMIGRGLLARPSLATEWRNNEEWQHAKRIATLLEFHDRLLSEYEQTLCGQTQILQHIKPFWDYLEEEIGHRCLKAIRKASTLDRYREAITTIE